jgi:hypothetical protein
MYLSIHKTFPPYPYRLAQCSQDLIIAIFYENGCEWSWIDYKDG